MNHSHGILMNNLMMRSAWVLVAGLFGFLILQFSGFEPWVHVANVDDNVAINDTLPNALASAILSPVPDSAPTGGHPCSLVLFFSSTCAACERVGPAWRNVGYVQVAGTVLPSIWFGRRSDGGAMGWIDRHDIPLWKLLSEDEWNSLGVRVVPSYYLLDEANRVRAIGVANARGVSALNDVSEDILSACEEA